MAQEKAPADRSTEDRQILPSSRVRMIAARSVADEPRGSLRSDSPRRSAYPPNRPRGHHAEPASLSWRASAIRRNTPAQSPRFAWRKSRIVGYQGESSRSRSQRHSATRGNASHVGLASAPGQMDDRGIGADDKVEMARDRGRVHPCALSVFVAERDDREPAPPTAPSRSPSAARSG